MSKNKETLSFAISGMHCASCASNIQRKLKKVDGVSEVYVNYSNEQATIKYEGKISEKEIAKTLDSIGYTAYLDSDSKDESLEKEKNIELKDLKKKLFISGILTSILMMSIYGII